MGKPSPRQRKNLCSYSIHLAQRVDTQCHHPAPRPMVMPNRANARVTGSPKLVTMTHGTFSVTDNDRNMPVPEGRRAQNAAQFNFEDGGRFFSCFPPYHVGI